MAPKKKPVMEEHEKPLTKHVRIPADLSDMLGWISKLRRMDTGSDWRIADFIEKHLRPVIEAEYSQYTRRIERIKKAMKDDSQ